MQTMGDMLKGNAPAIIGVLIAIVVIIFIYNLSKKQIKKLDGTITKQQDKIEQAIDNMVIE